LLLPLELAAQVWTFQLYVDDQPFTWSTFRLTEPSPGQYRARYVMPGGGWVDPCFRPELRATVVRTAEETIITVQPPMAGCGVRRLVIKTDGSGGRSENQQADGSWQWNGREHGLKLKQP
jgi:hypothetical protein